LQLSWHFSFIKKHDYRKTLKRGVQAKAPIKKSSRKKYIMNTNDAECREFSGENILVTNIEKDGRQRRNICPGNLVKVVLKKDQRRGKLTEGRVYEILTNSEYHPHGIKVRLEDGNIGRVKQIM
jgi:uncharacterized repeat protein (TIGR03833 family)